MNGFEKLLEEMGRRKDIYYHITPDDYGPVVEFYPRRPTSAMSYEPDDPRICVSPSLAGCLCGGSFSWKTNDIVYVYATSAPAIAVGSDIVFDADVTEEHWIEEPAVFVLVGEINLRNDVSAEAMEYMDNVSMPYESEDCEDEDSEYMTSCGYHMAAKEELESDLRHLEESIYTEARHKLARIIPRVKDVPGQGLFYFAKEDQEAEVEEAEEEKIEIPKVKAPGNFHQFIARRKKDETD